MAVTKSMHLIHATVADDGKKYAPVPRQPPHFLSSTKVTNADYTVENKADVGSIIEHLKKYGVVIVKNFISEDACDQIVHEIDPFFFRDESWNGSPFPRQTTVVTRSVLKSVTVRDQILCNQQFRQVSEHFLSETNYFWIGQKIRTGTSSIQLNSGIVYKVGPGASNQMYHREDMVHHNIHKERLQYIDGDETLVGLSVGFTNTTKQNGATRVVPGSHLWGEYRYPTDDECNYIELAKGDAAFMLGSAYHAASGNQTNDDRISSFYFMTKSYLKQEENLFVDYEMDFFKKLPADALSLMGLNLSEPFCGHMDYSNPLQLLKPLNEVGVNKENYGETIIPVISP